MDLRFRLARIEGGADSPLLVSSVSDTPLLLLNATAVPASCPTTRKSAYGSCTNPVVSI